jgi:peptidoglycan/LPS O-acetylase OafA/YrhL
MRFSVLDSLRGMAAMLVALYHVEILGEIYAGHLQGVSIINNAYLFVDFFFVLSGFVIAHAYQGRISNAEDLVSFAICRFGRVWPLHIAVLLAFLGFEIVKLLARTHGVATDSEPFSGSFSPPSILTNIVLAQSFGLGPGLTWNAPSWSIGVEFYTYLAFALLVVACRRRIAAASAVMVIGGALVVAAFSHHNMRTTFDYGFFRCLYGFFVGVLVYRFYTISRRFRLRGRILPTVLELVVTTIVAVFVSIAGARPISLFSPLIFGVAVYIFSCEQGSVSRLLLTRPFRTAGTLSYSIYMDQALVLIAMARVIRLLQAHFGVELRVEAMVEGRPQSLLWIGSDWSSDALVVLYLTLLLAAASLTYRLIENPGRAFFRNVALLASQRVKRTHIRHV